MEMGKASLLPPQDPVGGLAILANNGGSLPPLSYVVDLESRLLRLSKQSRTLKTAFR